MPASQRLLLWLVIANGGALLQSWRVGAVQRRAAQCATVQAMRCCAAGMVPARCGAACSLVRQAHHESPPCATMRLAHCCTAVARRTCGTAGVPSRRQCDDLPAAHHCIAQRMAKPATRGCAADLHPLQVACCCAFSALWLADTPSCRQRAVTCVHQLHLLGCLMER